MTHESKADGDARLAKIWLVKPDENMNLTGAACLNVMVVKEPSAGGIPTQLTVDLLYKNKKKAQGVLPRKTC